MKVQLKQAINGQQTTNGVEVNRMFETISAVKAQPERQPSSFVSLIAGPDAERITRK